jgi:hypothetical protein
MGKGPRETAAPGPLLGRGELALVPGAADGPLQTARCTGAIVPTSVIGIVYGATTGTCGLHVLAGVTAALGLGLLWASLARPAPASSGQAWPSGPRPSATRRRR